MESAPQALPDVEGPLIDEPVPPAATVAPRRRRAQPQPDDIRDVLTIKHDDVFILSDLHGDMPKGNRAGLGLYFRDTRFLSRLELRVEGIVPTFLHAKEDKNYSMVVETTLPIQALDPRGLIVTKNLSVLRRRWVERGLREQITVHNFGLSSRRISIELRFAADFLDLFEVRGLARDVRGETTGDVGGDAVTLTYDGVDGVRRELELRFSPFPRSVSIDRARFVLDVPTGGSGTVEIVATPRIGGEEPSGADLEGLAEDYAAWRESSTRFSTSNHDLQRSLDRAVLDLRMMQSSVDDVPMLQAGVPWFSTLFGRDALITAYQSLWVNPGLAAATLTLLAAYQATEDDPWRDAEPGKILHELRRGELANAGEIPHTPYYGSVDSTPLWLVLYGRSVDWTGDLALAERLWPNAERALEWMDRYGDADGDGFIEYRRRSDRGLDNQGWKDSYDGIVHADGTLPEPPIALVEVQGYAYDARRQAARVARLLGKTEVAAALEERAEELRSRLVEAFWMDDEGTFAVALDGAKHQVRSVTSNPGHLLWSGVLDEEYAAAVVRRLMQPDMLAGWGIRTLAATSRGFDPLGYHTGTVWPHDCALIAHGMKLCGFDAEAATVMDQVAAAAAFFPSGRMPELYCGFSREDVPLPVLYPVACRPQAFATGAVLLMVMSYLGLSADAFEGSLHISKPQLPTWAESLDVLGLRLGDARMSLALRRDNGVTGCQVLEKADDANVVITY